MKIKTSDIAPVEVPEYGDFYLPPPANLHELEECYVCREYFLLLQVSLEEAGQIVCAACSETNKKL